MGRLVFEQEGDGKTAIQTNPSEDIKTAVDGAVKAVDEDIAVALSEQPILKPNGRKKMYIVVIPKQNNTDNNRPVFVPSQEGGQDWRLVRGKEYTVPEYVVNIIRESIAISTQYQFEISSQRVRTVPIPERIPRFSLEIKKEFYV